jgi:heme ABC exporter ATP-binding subunit CcmA
LIKVENLSYSFNDFPLLENLNFEVNPSEIIHLKGKNGSGKSTLLKILSGILNNFQGKVLSTAKNVFFLGHSLGLKDSLSVKDNLLLDYRFNSEVDSLSEALKLFELNSMKETKLFNLSQGQRKKVSLVQLFLSKCDLFLLDEPFANLDKKGIELIENTIRDHQNRGSSVIFTSHEDHNISSRELAL